MRLTPNEIRELLPTMVWDFQDLSDEELDIQIANWQQLNAHVGFYLESLVNHRVIRNKNR